MQCALPGVGVHRVRQRRARLVCLCRVLMHMPSCVSSAAQDDDDDYYEEDDSDDDD